MTDATMSAAAVDELGADFRGVAEAFVDVADRAMADGGALRIPGGELARVMTAAVKLYAARADTEGALPPPISAEKITPTEVVIVVTEMLRAADLNLFDLAMWYRRASPERGQPA